jgi:hypothetical protein
VILGCQPSPPPVACAGMSARPVHEPDPDDPVEILRDLPAQFRDQFLAEYYEAASEAARQVGGYRQLHDLLRLWRLSAAAYSDPGSEERLQAVRRLSGPAAWKGLHRSGRSSLAGPTARELQVRFADGALVQLNGLPGAAFDALLERVVDLLDEPWDATAMPPGDDPAYRRTVFGGGYGLLT